MTTRAQAAKRVPLNRNLVLGAAVAMADEAGIDALSMRSLAHALGVVPMALYKHVANKEELLDGMVDVVIEEIDPLVLGEEWKSAVRHRILSARRALSAHPWAPRVIKSRTAPTPTVLRYVDSMVEMFRDGGFSVDLTHHVMHALGSRMWGFTLEVFDASLSSESLDPHVEARMIRERAETHSHFVEVALGSSRARESVAGHGCDDQFEFEFALDLLLDGFDRLHQRGWTSSGHPTRTATSE